MSTSPWFPIASQNTLLAAIQYHNPGAEGEMGAMFHIGYGRGDANLWFPALKLC